MNRGLVMNDTTESHGLHKLSTTTLVIAALGVVFGDIGTSPIYTLKECFSPHSPHHIATTHAHILAARHGIGRPMRTLVQLATEMHHSPSTIARWERAALAEARTLLSAERMTMSRPEPVSRARRSGASSAASPAR